MGYKLNVFDKIKESNKTFIELLSKTGISRARVSAMQKNNDAKLSDLFAIANFLGCEICDLYEIGDFDLPKKSKINKQVILDERRKEICYLLKTNFPDEIARITEIMKIQESEICERLWNCRVSACAQKRIERMTGNPNYLSDVLTRILKFKDSL